MGFMTSYKRLEKLCGEIYGDVHGVSLYIDDLQKLVDNNDYCFTMYKDDLKQLKHYRCMRNKITHEPDYSEENMCTKEDEFWLDNFYNRMLNQTDPLSRYRKIQRAFAEKNTNPSVYSNKTPENPIYYNNNRNLNASPRKVNNRNHDIFGRGFRIFLLVSLAIFMVSLVLHYLHIVYF